MRLGWVFAALWTACLLGCGPHPESVLTGRWREADWRYEKYDGYDPKHAQWLDGIEFPRDDTGRIVRHQAEYWEFSPNGGLVISKRDGSKVRAEWRLKGRGHVLSIRTKDAHQVELYDVEELNENELVLNYDIGMEVRGIAKLTFRRFAEGARADASRTRVDASRAQIDASRARANASRARTEARSWSDWL
jgi:hypothetical protein